MCGIAGVFGDRDPGRVERITAALFHRGPDQGGHFHRGELHLGIRRLSIIDPAGGDQPIVSPRRDRAIVMNGEIYNYRQLRQDLVRRGHEFTTSSDTEVVLRLFEEHGEDCLRHLRGMFAFAIADGDRIFLARDRFGIKPLYYSHLETAGLFLFASEMKALLRCPEVSSELSRQALGDILLLRHPFGPDTPFEQIRSLEPGCTLSVRRGERGLEVTHRRYYRLEVAPRDERDGDFEASIGVVREKLEETVEAHLVADVEVGALLSGGIDSGLLAALMSRRLGDRLRAFTVASSEDFADLRLSREIAGRLGARHEVLQLGFGDFLAAVPSFLLCTESVTRLAGLSAFLLARHVGQRMKVCLNGEGSDEIFGGYNEFLGDYGEIDHLQHGLQRVQAVGLGSGPRLREAVRALLAARRAGPQSYLRGLFQWHLGDRLVHHHLHFMDQIGMAASLEIRVPYVDHELVELAASLPLRYKVDLDLKIQKHILKRVALDGFGPLLASAVLRSKVGFPATDAAHQATFRRLCQERLGDRYRRSHELGPVFGDNAELLLFELFELIFVENRGVLPTGFDLEELIAEKASHAAARVESKIFVLS